MKTERDRPMCREGRHLYPCSLFLTFSKHSQLQRDTIQHLVYARSAYIFAGSLAVTNAPHISHFNIPENYIFQKENYSQTFPCRYEKDDKMFISMYRSQGKIYTFYALLCLCTFFFLITEK